VLGPFKEISLLVDKKDGLFGHVRMFKINSRHATGWGREVKGNSLKRRQNEQKSTEAD
jgi:hypothetical protein